jgi:hypothetical protein
MSELYLILHKVRGEPALDIAQNIGDETGDLWIIPTSGHRAYPVMVERIEEVLWENYDKEMFESVPDHYQVTKAPPPKLNIRSLLAGIRPTLNLKRRI